MSERLSNALSVRLASRADALCIAQMSRLHVELGVGWSWRPERVLHAIRAADCVVLGAYPAIPANPQARGPGLEPPTDARTDARTDASTRGDPVPPEPVGQAGMPSGPASQRGPVGFAIMRFGVEEAHLLLLCVAPRFRRQGVAAALLRWLESAALTAGVSIVRLEQRADNPIARRFYTQQGFCYVRRRRGYYAGRIDALELAKDLWDRTVPDGP
ncbi:MAG: GNAT family N-acetyltransferase [Gammaproteobacteria bacterium]|nr:GNAT family N-acetyltransferase [Gammaproteobacteria bacterium]